ncbi:hypothetical protein FSP39_012133, partial [Pinctada imbricata]
ISVHIAPPGDFIALGKQSKQDSDSSKLAQLSQKKLGSGLDRKRDAPSAPIPGALVKRPKIVPQGQTFTPLGRAETERRASPAPTTLSQFEELAIEVDSHNLLEEVLEAEDTCNDERMEGLLCGAVKHLHYNRSKPDQAVYLTLMYLAKTHSAIFNSDVVIQAISSLLRRDLSLNFKSKGNCLVSVLACEVLMEAFDKEDNWPDDFVKVFVEDSLGERVWVDRSDCKAFTDNIITAFNTNLPVKPTTSSETNPTKETSGTASPVVMFLQEEDESTTGSGASEEKVLAIEEIKNIAVTPRYQFQQETIESYIMDIIKDQFNKRQPMDSMSRNFIRFLTATSGYGEVRLLAAQKLEIWLQNPKLSRSAQELLMAICMNCNQHDQNDLEVVALLVKIRMKTKPLLNHFLSSLKELLNQSQENLRLVMTHTIYNELSNTRNPNNMAVLGVLFQSAGEQAAKTLAEIVQDLLANKDDYLRAERYVTSITDLVTLSIFLSISSSVREAASAVTKGEKKDLDTLHTFRQQVSLIQRDAVWWMHTIVPSIIEVKLSDYVFCLHKILFMENSETYYNTDNWPTEQDRVSFLHLASNVPVLEDTLMRVLVIGLSHDLPLPAPDAVELSDQLVKRAASLCLDGKYRQVVLRFERLELVDALFNLCTYRHPTDISLPKGYKPPSLAISNLYWKSWVILLILTAFNPRTFGLAGWENYPTLRCMMEMTMTGNYNFPPPTMATDGKAVEELRQREKQVHEHEKQLILEFEGHLAAATSKVTITESNSLLVKQLTTMEPNGKARRPPDGIMEQIKILNENLHIGQMLCRSRQPDFLLDIIQRQGTSQSMPWLAELVESSEGSLDKLKKREQLLHRLQTIVREETDNVGTAQVLDYFLKRLSSTQANNRALAIKGLSMIVTRSGDADSLPSDNQGITQHKWLFDDLPTIPSFSDVKGQICDALRQACLIETDPNLVSAYIIFLSEQTLNQSQHELDDLALDMAQLIVERTSVINHILPQSNEESLDISHTTLKALIDLYYSYLCKAKEPSKEAYNWSNTQDQIILQWEGGDSATMHVLVVHAMIILLTYGPPNKESPYKVLLDTWFPENGHPPSAFLLDTSEEALLLPDWLKLRMIRSHVKQLVDVALQDIEPSQLLLFVQSFGIPVASMSCLFKCLDDAVTQDPGLLEQALEDKTYMAQLIEIQHMRGVTGGETFYKLLKQGSPVKAKETPSVEMTDSSPTQKKWSQTVEHLGSQHGSIFASAFSRSLRACPLLKELVAKHNVLGGLLTKLMETLAKMNPDSKSYITGIVNQSLKSAEVMKERKSPSLSLSTREDVNGKHILDELIKLSSNNEDGQERIVRRCMYDSMTSKDRGGSRGSSKLKHFLLDAAFTSLINDDHTGTEVPKSMAVLNVDWLGILDPEIVKTNPEMALKLLFARQPTDVSEKHKNALLITSQPFIMALLTHQSSWSSLHICIDFLLKNTSTVSYNPSVVLDFLWACLHIPKIWQGMDRSVPKNYKAEDVLGLTSSQVIAVADYIVQEASINKDLPEPSDQSIADRIHLLMLCICNNHTNLQSLVNHIQQIQNQNKLMPFYQELLAEIYAQCPRIILPMMEASGILPASQLSRSSLTKVDVMSHRLLTSLGQAGHGKRAEDRMYDANIACRKLASQHPLLMLRQLPLIAALLKGKTQFTFGEMRHKNYLLLFTHILGLMETLQPHIFNSEYSSMQSIIESYFSLISNHGQEKQLGPMIVKFIKFLHNYASNEPQRSTTHLQKFVPVLSTISNKYPDLSSLKFLLSGLSLSRQSGESSKGEVTVAVAPRPTSPLPLAQLTPFLNRLKNSTCANDMMEVLNDLDETSKRKVDILEHFVGDLKKLLINSSDRVRNTAYSLIMRHIRQNPKTAEQFVGIYLQCLDSNNPDIVTSALKNLPEFCILCQDYADVILQKSFIVGNQSLIETCTYISETLQLLNLETTQI